MPSPRFYEDANDLQRLLLCLLSLSLFFILILRDNRIDCLRHGWFKTKAFYPDLFPWASKFAVRLNRSNIDNTNAHAPKFSDTSSCARYGFRKCRYGRGVVVEVRVEVGDANNNVRTDFVQTCSRTERWEPPWLSAHSSNCMYSTVQIVIRSPFLTGGERGGEGGTSIKSSVRTGCSEANYRHSPCPCPCCWQWLPAE